jgi:hypothetical protein
MSPNDCTEVQNYLLKRLEKDAPIVKLKSLRVIKHVILKGHETFHKDLQRRFQPIKNCTRERFLFSLLFSLLFIFFNFIIIIIFYFLVILEYRGPPDLLHGDTPFRLVREIASVRPRLILLNEVIFMMHLLFFFFFHQLSRRSCSSCMRAQTPSSALSPKLSWNSRLQQMRSRHTSRLHRV